MKVLKYRCPFCKRFFATPKDRQNHILGQPPYRPNKCGTKGVKKLRDTTKHIHTNQD